MNSYDGLLRIITPQGVRIVGEVVKRNGNLVFEKVVNKSAHLLRILDAWGIQKEVLDNLINKEIKVISIFDREEEKTYRIETDRFLEYAITKDLGHGEQYFCKRKYFQVEEKGNNQLSLSLKTI